MLIIYLSWVYKCKIKKYKIPLNSSIIINDDCNLNCKHCNVANLGYPKQSIEQIQKQTKMLYELGSRMLVITGGEPFLRKDNNKNLEDVIKYAKQIGFFRTVVCTNGTIELNSNSDYLWVSLDGFGTNYNNLRNNKIYNKVINNIQKSKHKKIFINYTISKINLVSFETDIENILRISNVKGILIHIFTPYLGLSDSPIRLTPKEIKLALTKLLVVKQRHPIKISNSFADIKSMINNNRKRPIWASVVINQGEITECCCRKRIYNKKICKVCGYSPAVETRVLQQLKLSAIIENFRFL